MVETFELTNYNFYSSRLDMELITNIVDTLKEILEEDKKQEQPLFLKVADDLSGRMIITKTRQKSCLKQEAMMLCLKQGSALILRM